MIQGYGSGVDIRDNNIINGIHSSSVNEIEVRTRTREVVAFPGYLPDARTWSEAESVEDRAK